MMKVDTQRDEVARLQISDGGIGKIQKSLECPICWSILISPVRQCRRGHCICAICYRSMDKCGLCREDLLNIRCLTIEAILEHVTISCTYDTVGCTIQMKPSAVREHEQICQFRPIKCAIIQQKEDRCDTFVEFNNYKRHLMESHRVLILNKGVEGHTFRVQLYDNAITDEQGFWPILQFHFNSQMFLVWTSLENDRFTSWITVVGTDVDASKYGFKLTLEVSPTDPEHNKMWVHLPVMSAHCQTQSDLKGTKLESVSASMNEIKKYCDRSSSCPRNDALYDYSWCVLYECYLRCDMCRSSE